jgi:hypothetical protein
MTGFGCETEERHCQITISVSFPKIIKELEHLPY